MDPTFSSETVLEAGSGLSRSQILRLEILRESIFETYGTDADLLEVFLEAFPAAQWPIFMLLYPKVAFLMEKIVEVIREVDKLFVDEYEIKLYGIESPLLYVQHTRINQWRERFDVIIAARPGSNLWTDTIWDFTEQVQKTDGGSLIDQMDSNLFEMPERILISSRNRSEISKPASTSWLAEWS